MKNLIACCLVIAFVAVGCASQQPIATPKTRVVTQASLDSNLAVIENLEPQLDQLDIEFHAFPHPAQLGRNYFDAQEIDSMEGLLFRFQAAQTSLWDIVNSYGGLDQQFADDLNHTKAEVLALSSTLLIASHTAFIVDEFAQEPIAIDLMNQVYYRSEIPFGSYDRMRDSMTDPLLLKAVTDAKNAYAGALADPDSSLSRLAQSDAEYAVLIAQLPALHDQSEDHLQRVASYDPSHAKSVRQYEKDTRGQHKERYKLRSFLFKTVSRMKKPTAHVLVFTDAQKKQIFDLLEPGDLILTYTAGYMSDVFIPGAFKHGITYIGSKDDRSALGLSANSLPTDERFDSKELAANLLKTTLPSGQSIDMIESVAEGVIFNSLEHIMDTHINRMLVLRPQLSPAERVEFIAGVYSYLGDGYDFRFDFADASQQVCTEVIYRAINGKAGIEFGLTVRGGHETLSADDIANYHLQAPEGVFEFVLLVEPDAGENKNNAGTVYTGSEGEGKLVDLMASVSKRP